MSIWDHDTTFTFLELYKNHPCIWDVQHKYYKNKKLNHEAWNDIVENMLIDCSVDELKKKKESLMTTYRKCKMMLQRAEDSGVVYEVGWFAFSYMDAFLGPIYTRKLNTKNTQNEDTTDYEADDTRSSIEFETDEPVIVYESSPQQEYSIQTTSKSRKRKYDPIQLFTDIKKEKEQRSDQPFTEKVVQEIVHFPDDDECATFGTLVAQKLRKLSDDRRDVMMVKINQLFVDERQNITPKDYIG